MTNGTADMNQPRGAACAERAKERALRCAPHLYLDHLRARARACARAARDAGDDVRLLFAPRQ